MRRLVALVAFVSLSASPAAAANPLDPSRPLVRQVVPVVVVTPNKTSGPWGTPSAPAYAPGLALSIRWRYTGTPPGQARVILVRDGQPAQVFTPSTPWGSGGEGGLLWVMPEDLYGPHLFRVKVESTVDPEYQGTGAEFASVPMLRVTEPTAAGLAWKAGTSHAVRWLHSAACGETVGIKAVMTSTTWSSVLDPNRPIGPGFNGSYWWTIPADFKPGEYRIHLRSSNGACSGQTPVFTVVK